MVSNKTEFVLPRVTGHTHLITPPPIRNCSATEIMASFTVSFHNTWITPSHYLKQHKENEISPIAWMATKMELQNLFQNLGESSKSFQSIFKS